MAQKNTNRVLPPNTLRGRELHRAVQDAATPLPITAGIIDGDGSVKNPVKMVLSGIEAGTYTDIESITVNEYGVVVEIVEATPDPNPPPAITYKRVDFVAYGNDNSTGQVEKSETQIDLTDMREFRIMAYKDRDGDANLYLQWRDAGVFTDIGTALNMPVTDPYFGCGAWQTLIAGARVDGRIRVQARDIGGDGLSAFDCHHLAVEFRWV